MSDANDHSGTLDIPKMELDVLNVMKQPLIPHSYLEKSNNYNDQYPNQSVPKNAPVQHVKNDYINDYDVFTNFSSYSSYNDDQIFQGQQKRRCCYKEPPMKEEKQCDHNEISDFSFSSEENMTSLLLGEPDPNDVDKICLVLDLDETLIHSSFVPVKNCDFTFHYVSKSNDLTVYVNFRPNAVEFVKNLAPLYEIVFFTASYKEYADPIIEQLDEEKMVKYRLYRDSCTELGGNFVKDLSRMNRRLERIIILDNSPTAYLLQPDNAISISSWYEDQKDQELKIIMDYLIQNHNARNIYELFHQ